MRSRRPTILASLLAAAALSLLAAGCGGSPSAGVASLGASSTAAATTTTNSSGAKASAASGPPGGAPGGHFSVAMKVANAADGAKFSACMRKHGLQNFPDPNAQGVIRFDSSSGIDPSSPAFQSAQTACRKLLPNGGEPTPAQKAKMQQQALAFSKCMRAHGIKDFPDPSNGGLRIHVQPGSDLDPNNPQFQSAQKACRGNLPFKGLGSPPAGKPGGGGG